MLLNFNMSKDKIILPRDIGAHDKVYTYIRNTNTLYRGDKSIRSPAVLKLSGGSRPMDDQTTNTSGSKRSFSPKKKRRKNSSPNSSEKSIEE